MPGIFSQVEGPVLLIIGDLLIDQTISEEVSYMKFAEQVFSETDGHNVDKFDASTLRTIRLRHTLRSSGTASGNVERGDQFFLFKYTDLPSDFSLKDKIVDAAGKEYSFTSIDKILELAVAITVNG